MRVRNLALAGLLCAIVSAPSVKAEGLAVVDAQLRSEIAQAFFDGGDWSLLAVDQFAAGLAKRREQALAFILRKETQHEKTEKKVQKSALSDDLILSYDLALRKIRELKEQIERQSIQAYETAHVILEIDYSTKVEGDILAIVNQYRYVRNSLRTWKIERGFRPDAEAADLSCPDTVTPCTQNQLKNLVRQGQDISKLNPVSDSTFWENTPIASLDVKSFYLNGENRLHANDKARYPKEPKVYYHSIHKTQSKPKIDVYFTDTDGKKVKLKLKIGKETHSEPTASALSAALGFYNDIPIHVAKIKLVLGETTFEEFEREWFSYYSSYKLANYIQERGKDGEGNYIVFFRGLLEYKSKRELRVGPWAWEETGHRAFRAARGMSIFNIWIGNTDIKAAENNKLVFQRDGSGPHEKMFHLQHDMGFAFGGLWRENPDQFVDKVVASSNRRKVVLNYHSFQSNTAFPHLTEADARWMLRRIAALSKQQIKDAVELGGWPVSHQMLLVEKLLHRRNELIKAFGLESEIGIVQANTKMTSPDKIVKLGKITQDPLPTFPEKFDPSMFDKMVPVLEGLRDRLVNTIVDATSLVKGVSLSVEGNDIGWGITQISTLKINIDRAIDSNPHSKSAQDRYIVRDRIRLGYELGIGYVAEGTLTYVKEVTLHFPVPSRQAGMYAGGFIFNLLLPFTSAMGLLPEKYVVSFEDYFEAGVGLRLSDLFSTPFSPTAYFFGVGAKAGTSKIFLSRNMVSHKQEGIYRLYHDTSVASELAGKLYVSLGFLNLPFAKRGHQLGTINRNIFVISEKKIFENNQNAILLNSALASGNLEGIAGIARTEAISSDFYEYLYRFNILGFFVVKSSFRTDKIHWSKLGEDKIEDEYLLQVRAASKKAWSFFGNGETHRSEVGFSAITDPRFETSELPSIQVGITEEDLNTHDQELGSYLDLMNQVADNPKFIDFTPKDHSVNELWGKVNTYVDILYRPAAVARLLALRSEQVWSEVEKFTSLSRGQMRKLLSASPSDRGSQDPVLLRHHNLVKGVQKFIWELENVHEAKLKSDQVTHLVRGLRHLLWKSKGAYTGTAYQIIHRLIGLSDIELTALATVPEDTESKFPGRAPLFNYLGTDGKASPMQRIPYVFGVLDPATVYNSL